MSDQALSGLRVVELGDFISAAWCAKLMADLGAEVAKVESPIHGDSARHHGPFLGNVPHPERSGLFLNLNTNKLGVTLDVATSTGRGMLLHLLEFADVFVENNPPARMEEWGLDYTAIKRVNPRLIMTSITPFGQTGPYRDYKAYDINICAAGGLVDANGEPGREPICTPLSQGHLQAGLAAASGTMFAVLAREATGEGQQVDISATDVVTTALGASGNVQSYILENRVRQRTGHRTLALYPWTILPCKDGYVSLMAVQGFQWKRFLEIVGDGEVPDWYSRDPRFKDRLATGRKYADEMDALLAPWLMEHTKEEIFELCQSRSVPFTPVRTMEDAVNDRHLRERGFFVEVERAETGLTLYPGAPFQFSKTPWSARRPAPLLGEHNEEVYCGRLGLSRGELSELGRGRII